MLNRNTLLMHTAYAGEYVVASILSFAHYLCSGLLSFWNVEMSVVRFLLSYLFAVYLLQSIAVACALDSSGVVSFNMKYALFYGVDAAGRLFMMRAFWLLSYRPHYSMLVRYFLRWCSGVAAVYSLGIIIVFAGVLLGIDNPSQDPARVASFNTFVSDLSGKTLF